MAKYIQTASSVQPHIDFIIGTTVHLPKDVQDQVLFHLACIMNKGFRCNPRPTQGTIRRTALETAFRKYPEVKFNFTEVKGYNGKMFKALSITVNSHTDSGSDDSDE
jgi:hypothetical protein